MEECPLFQEHQKLFRSEITCGATDENLGAEGELVEQFCSADFRKCLRYQTYHDLRIEYLVRKKLREEFGA